MEPLGLGANVVAFIVLASQLSKVLYNTFSSIKDGPNNVRRISNHLLQLHGILDQLRHSPLARHDAELAEHIKSCVSDLEPLFNTVQKFQRTKGDIKTNRMWKRFQAFLGESQLDYIREQVITHITTLNFRLSLLHSNATCELLSSTDRVNQSIDRLICNVGEQTEILDSKIGDVRSTFNSRHENLQSEFVFLQNAVNNISSVSQRKMDIIIELLNEMKNGITNPNRGEFQGGTLRDDASEKGNSTTLRRTNSNDDMGPDTGLIRSIKRLSRLVQEKSITFDRDSEEDTQADDIIADLWILVDSVQNTAVTHEVSSIGMRSSFDPKILRRNLMRFRHSFGPYGIVLNQDGELKPKEYLPRRSIANIYAARESEGTPSTAVRQERTYTRATLGGLGTVSVMVTKCRPGPSSRKGNSTEIGFTSYTTVLSFMPKDPRHFAMIVASATQGRTAKESINTISRLAVNRVLPVGSRVFTIVKNGRLQELRAMLQEGTATLRDHDEHGASLLFYAAFSRQVEMCKFLLENGADVDHVSSAHGLGGWLYNDKRPRYVLELDMMFGEIGPKTPGNSQADSCRRLILEAGADPSATTLTDHKVTPGFLEWAVTSGHPETNQLIWGFGSGKVFIDINEPLPTGMPPFLHSCTNFAGDRAIEGLCILLDAGADIDARDDQGQSCLHRCLPRLWAPLVGKWMTKQFGVLQLLVTRGADVHARDYHGQSVCDVAYSQKDYGYMRRGSYVGDLWDVVLHSCGYDIAEFRQNHQRKAHYTKSYTRQDFEAIWKGREDQCPYWNDEPWPPEARSCYTVKLNEDQDQGVRETDISGRDRFEGPTEPAFNSSMHEDKAPWTSWSRQDQPGLGVTEVIDTHHTWRTALDRLKTEDTCLIPSDEDEEYKSAWGHQCIPIKDVEFPDIFENPWL